MDRSKIVYSGVTTAHALLQPGALIKISTLTAYSETSFTALSL
jgi:hypothetical protein